MVGLISLLRYCLIILFYCGGLISLLYMKLNHSINTVPLHHSFFNVLVVAAMFLHAKITRLFNFEREGLCLQTLGMRANINFGPLYQDDAITVKKLSRRDGIPHL